MNYIELKDPVEQALDEAVENFLLKLDSLFQPDHPSWRSDEKVVRLTREKVLEKLDLRKKKRK